MIFDNPNLGIINIETHLNIPVIKEYPEGYYKYAISRVDKTTLLKEIKIKDVVIEHIWIPCNLIGNGTVGITKQYIGEIYTYERKNRTLDYGIKIIGIPIE